MNWRLRKILELSPFWMLLLLFLLGVVLAVLLPLVRRIYHP